jgi:hypothetical protein
MVSANNSQELMMKTKYALFFKLIGSLFALVLLAAPSLAFALTITQVLVVVGGAQYCDTTGPNGCTNTIWNLNGGVTLGGNQTLILTQVGTTNLPASHGGEDFDTSDRGGAAALQGCHNPTAADPTDTHCTVQIYINSGSGLVQVVNDTSGNANPLAAMNEEPTSDVSTTAATLFQEDETWVPAPTFTGTGYTLDLAYADNIHGGTCAGGTATGCFPQHDWCSSPGGVPTTACPAAATFFLGAGIGPIGNCGGTAFSANGHDPTDAAGKTVGCYDGGALRITANVPPPPAGLIAPTATTCLDVLNGTASTLDQINYSVSHGKIAQGINPGVFFYYAKITVAPGTVTVTESQNDAAALFQIQQGQAKLYSGDCSSSTAGTLIAGNTGASFSVAAAGNYIISIKYSTKSIAGTTAPTSDPVTYTFVANPPGASSSASVLLKKQ